MTNDTNESNSRIRKQSLPCPSPHCQSKVTCIDSNRVLGGTFVKCGCCRMQGPIGYDVESAIQRWNALIRSNLKEQCDD